MIDLILDKIFVENVDYAVNAYGCWLWLGSITSNGYPRIWLNGRELMVHRYTHCQKYNKDYISLLHADHKYIPGFCVTECINPDHIQMLKIGENVLRGNGLSAENAKLTCCKTCGGELKLRKRKRRNPSRYCPKCQYKRL